MAASHHHQQSHHMNNIHGSSATTATTTCIMSEEEEEDDLAALRVAALKTLEERKLKKEPRALIVQRNNVLVIEPQDNVSDFRHSPPTRRFSRERSLSPVGHRRRSREASPGGRKISPPSCRWSPRGNNHRRSPSPYHMNGGHHSPAHHSWNSSKRRPSPRAHSPRRLPDSPRRRSPVRRRSPPRRSPHRLPLSPSRRSPRKSPPRSPVRRSSPQRSPATGRSPRKSPVRGSPRRFSPRRRLRDSSDSRQSKSTRRNGDKRRASPPTQSSSSVLNRRRTASPRRRDPTVRSPDPREATEVVAPSAKKGRFERFEDSGASDDDSCNESLLDELFRETEETSARTEALEAESLDENSQEKSGVVATPVVAEENKMEDEDCLLLQADDDMDDLLVECNAPETVAVSVNKPTEKSGPTESKKGEQDKIFKERDLDDKNRGRSRHNDHRSESSSETVPRSRHSRSERTARIEKKENRERKSKISRDDHKTEGNTEKRKRSRSREKDRSKRKPSRKTSDKEERHTSDPKLEARPQSHISKSRAQTSPEKNISVEDRERLEARKKKFLQKELKPSQKVISLKRSPTSKTEDTDDVRRVQDRLGEPVKESKRSSPRSDDAVETSSKPTILSRLGPPPASRTSIKDRIGHINTNSSSPTQTSLTGTDAAQVKFEVRNRPTLDPKLKIHINLGGTLSTGSSGGSSKSKKVVCLE